MGSGPSVPTNQPHSSEDLIALHMQIDPDFDIEYYQKLLHPKILDAIDVISIRRAFLTIRDDRVDPEEFVRLKRLRRFNILTPEDLAMIERHEHPVL